MKKSYNICDLDFEILDNYVLKGDKISSKHVSYPTDAVPGQGSQFLNHADSIKNIEKRHAKNAH